MSGFGEGAVYREARRAYDEDRVEAALALLDSMGASFGGASLGFRATVAGEVGAKRYGPPRPEGPDLDMEPDPGDSDAALVRTTLDEIQQRFGPAGKPVRVAFLPSEADAPWHGARYGYYVPKTEHDKVCVPGALLFDPEELRRTLLHEFAHLVVQNRTEGRAPKWLHEGVAQLAEGRPVRPAQGQAWTAATLDAAFEADRRADGGWRRAGEAYDASLRMVARLHTLKGDDGLCHLLDAFTDNSVLANLRILAGALDPSDEALRQIYTLSLTELLSGA